MLLLSVVVVSGGSAYSMQPIKIPKIRFTMDLEATQVQHQTQYSQQNPLASSDIHHQKETIFSHQQSNQPDKVSKKNLLLNNCDRPRSHPPNRCKPPQSPQFLTKLKSCNKKPIPTWRTRVFFYLLSFRPSFLVSSLFFSNSDRRRFVISGTCVDAINRREENYFSGIVRFFLIIGGDQQ
ncbi:unnamed protein product [Periconia digitata]|uniref:Uncharacterized protein n=1 Tax=Periconia digitata TaxID=1303443 RepID=A0A9W4XPZ6_9PLEO|nr:unnamed protein product [Periconia digitata]